MEEEIFFFFLFRLFYFRCCWQWARSEDWIVLIEFGFRFHFKCSVVNRGLRNVRIRHHPALCSSTTNRENHRNFWKRWNSQKLTNSFDFNFNLNIRWIKIEAYKNNRKPSPHYGRDNTSFPQALLLNNFGSRKINAIQKNLYSRVIVSILRKINIWLIIEGFLLKNGVVFCWNANLCRLQLGQSFLSPLGEHISTFLVQFLIVWNFSFACRQPLLNLGVVVQMSLVYRLYKLNKRLDFLTK